MLAAADRASPVGVDVAGCGRSCLDAALIWSTWSLVEAVIAIVRRAASCRARFGDAREVFVDGAGEDSVVVDVGVERRGIAASQLQGRGCFPGFVEAVDAVEFDRSAGAAQFVEHAATADGLELVGVADEDQSPVVGGRRG